MSGENTSHPRSGCVGDYFLDYLNSKHPNIQFTHELENNGSLSFLDINITRTNGRFSTSVFHKPTSTGLFTNFNSFIPMTYKKGLLLSLISRYFNIPFTVNFRTLNKYFPLTVIQLLLLTIASELFSTIYSRLNHLFIPALKRFFAFAFHTQANMVYKYTHNFTNYFQKLTHIFLFVLSFVLRVDCLTFFHSRTEFLLGGPNVVYKYKCQCCGALYVGQTRRHIHTRTLNIWEFRPKLEIRFQSHKCLLFLLTIISPNIPFLTLTLLY